ncbi:unnamed protein product [Dibothriocephalus latus]|uniref:PDZ domain-containing protein n=1 Tax=Dibothriocephalus latus TaxID=60516 RepID=A0A3P6V7B8_DIBLA|nr:unnamed protein product [Dibothriocephalus latus]
MTPTPNAVRSISLQPPMQTSFGGTTVTYGGPSNETSSGRDECTFPMERRYTPQPGGQTTYTETSPDGHFLRTVVLQKGRDGFGFTLNGVPKVALGRNGLHRKGFPGNHYFPTILPGGPAAKAGIKPGDYVIEINGHSVIDACHEDAVQWIHDAGDTLAMRVVTLNNRRADPYEENSESDASSSRSSTLPRSLNGSSSSSTIYDKRSRSHVRLDDRSSRRRGRSMQPTTSDRDKVWTSRPSPATQSKERVFIIQDIDGKVRSLT